MKKTIAKVISAVFATTLIISTVVSANVYTSSGVVYGYYGSTPGTASTPTYTIGSSGRVKATNTITPAIGYSPLDYTFALQVYQSSLGGWINVDSVDGNGSNYSRGYASGLSIRTEIRDFTQNRTDGGHWSVSTDNNY